MKLIHSTSRTKESGWIETTTYDKYYYDRESGQVTHIRTVDVDNPYKSEHIEGKEIVNEVLSPEEVPEEVREQITALLNLEISYGC